MVGKSKPLDTDVCLYARLFCSNVETCILYIMIYTNVSMTMHKTLTRKVGNGSPMYKDFEILICFRWNLFGLFSSLYDQLFVESCISFILLYTLMRKSGKMFVSKDNSPKYKDFYMLIYFLVKSIWFYQSLYVQLWHCGFCILYWIRMCPRQYKRLDEKMLRFILL